MTFEFEKSPWDLALEALKPGDRISAIRFLTLLEGEDEDALEAAFLDLEEKNIALDISALPELGFTGEAAVRLQQEAAFVKGGMKLAGLAEDDPLRLYLQELAQTPVCGDIALLAEEIAAGNEDAMGRAANLMLSRVVEQSAKLTGRGVLLLDMIQEGSLGLWQGILQYNEGDLEAQCIWWIDQYLAKAVTLQARSNGIGEKLRDGMADYRDVDQRLLAELGRNPTLEEIAEAMHISPEEAATYQAMLQSAQARRQVEMAREPKEQTPDDEQAVENTAYFQSRQRIMELLSVLDEKDRELLTLRFGLEGELPLDPAQVAARLGITAEEVVTREGAALAKLRQ
jgi:RNA polymerase primary sigma factor